MALFGDLLIICLAIFAIMTIKKRLRPVDNSNPPTQMLYGGTQGESSFCNNCPYKQIALKKIKDE